MMTSPMFINLMNEQSPPTTRQHHHCPTSTQPNAVNFTLNLNVNSEYRPSTNA